MVYIGVFFALIGLLGACLLVYIMHKDLQRAKTYWVNKHGEKYDPTKVQEDIRFPYSDKRIENERDD